MVIYPFKQGGSNDNIPNKLLLRYCTLMLLLKLLTRLWHWNVVEFSLFSENSRQIYRLTFQKGLCRGIPYLIYLFIIIWLYFYSMFLCVHCNKLITAFEFIHTVYSTIIILYFPVWTITNANWLLQNISVIF